MAQEKVMASVTMKSRKGLCVFSHFKKLTAR